MKRYRLKMDLPTLPAGAKCRISKNGHLVHGDKVLYRENEIKKYPNILTDWFGEIKEETIISKLAGLEIASSDYKDGDKEYFTFEEALEAEKKLKDGWRLPTRHEWALICEEFACREDGQLNGNMLMVNLGLGRNGILSQDNIGYVGRYGNYWSATSSSSAYAYRLNFDQSSVNPSGDSYRANGFSVRWVRELNGGCND